MIYIFVGPDSFLMKDEIKKWRCSWPIAQSSLLIGSKVMCPEMHAEQSHLCMHLLISSAIININISVFILILLLYFFSLEYYFFQCHVICTIRGSCRLFACLCKVFVWWIANFDWIVNNIPRRSFFSTIKKKKKYLLR